MYKILTILIVSFFLIFPLSGQVSFRVMSYNVENLFDLYDDPYTADEEFLPSGNRRWTPKRYYHKLQQIAKVINAAGEWDTPALVGLCEVENDTVLTHLLTRTPLRNQAYRYCMTNGSDQRGINVALLYQRDKFKYLKHQSVRIRYASRDARPTRDILHVCGLLLTHDTLDVLVCHFPSKYGGEKESESRRMDAAYTLKRVCDSIIRVRANPQIIIMGDFNESPDKACMQLVAGKDFLNLFADYQKQTPSGSQKYQSEWSQLDQILIYRRMATPKSTMRWKQGSAKTFAPPFLFINDKTWRGKRPYRTYHGYKYEGGFSDHLPVIADFLLYLSGKE